MSDADEKELAEAEALAAALEGSTREGDAPEEALSTAAMLRYSGSAGELSAERSDAILSELESVPIPAPEPASRWRLWLPLGLSAAAAAAVALVVVTGSPMPEAARVATPAADLPPAPARSIAPSTGLPRPGAALLGAQAGFARGEKQAEAFDREMHAYRQRILRRLEATYPVTLGMLDGRHGP